MTATSTQKKTMFVALIIWVIAYLASAFLLKGHHSWLWVDTTLFTLGVAIWITGLQRRRC